MGDYLRVKNWEKFQHYKKRDPPWIKLHRSILSDPDFVSMPESAQYELVRVWLLASSRQGVVSSRQDLVRKMSGLRRLRYWKLFIKRGFLFEDASILQAHCKQDAIAEREAYKEEGETETEKDVRRSVRKKRESEPPFVWQGIELKVSEKTDKALRAAYPSFDVNSEYSKADAWMVANPGRRKGTAAFVIRWFQRAENFKESRSVGISNGGTYVNRAEQRSTANREAFEGALRKAADRDRAETLRLSGGDGGDPDTRPH